MIHGARACARREVEVRLSVHIVRFDFEGGAPAIAATLEALVRASEEAGAHAISFMDHYLQMGGAQWGGAHAPMLEGYTALGFLAAHSSRVELRLLVTGVTYRHPGLLARIVSTLDVLSGGRAQLGIGAAWYEREHAALGVPFPPPAERFERLEETLRILRQMWSDESGPFEGKHYRLAETINQPQPLHRIPVLVGGGGERKTLRLVARYADACNLTARPGGLEAVRHKLEVLRAHCEREGTDYERIEKTVLWSPPQGGGVEDAAGFIEEMRPYAELGVSEVIVIPPAEDAVGFVRMLGTEVIPELSPL
jgi:F420-dependent oxidoreductase-like protein